MTGEAPAPARPPHLAFLPSFLFGRADPAWRYVLKAWPVALLPSLALAYLLSLAVPSTGRPDFAVEDSPLAVLVATLVVIGPFVETLIMAGLLELLTRIVRPGIAVIVSAVLWGLAHSYGPLLVGQAPLPSWGLVVWWPFLILSIAYLNWRGRGRWIAILVATAIHGLQNAVGAAALVAGA